MPTPVSAWASLCGQGAVNHIKIQHRPHLIAGEDTLLGWKSE